MCVQVMISKIKIKINSQLIITKRKTLTIKIQLFCYKTNKNSFRLCKTIILISKIKIVLKY